MNKNKLSRSSVYALIALLLTAIAAILLWINRRELEIAYHVSQMNAAYDKIFGNPDTFVNGLAGKDVTGIDVDAVMEEYTYHRQRLVELGRFGYLHEIFSSLAVSESPQSHERRREFVNRMWRTFPYHKHYYLSPEGGFEAWDEADRQEAWDEFIVAERQRLKSS